MTAVEFYPALRTLHLVAVGCSLAFFAARGAGVLLGAAWPMAVLARRASVAIDTVLLAAGASLWALLGLNPVRDTWLGVKLVLLLVYIVLGSFALKRAPTRFAKAGFYLAALLCVALMVAIARAHDARLVWPG